MNSDGPSRDRDHSRIKSLETKDELNTRHASITYYLDPLIFPSRQTWLDVAVPTDLQ